MEVIVVVVLIIIVLMMLPSKKSSSGSRRSSSYKPRPRKTKSKNRKSVAVKQYDFDPRFFKPFEGKAHIIDGDTIVVQGQKVRLAGVNAPELDQAWGQKSKWEMVSICKGKVVRVVPNGETSYDRIVATCYIDENTDIGAELISRGLARDIPAFTGGKYKKYETGAGRRRVKPIPYNNNAQPKPELPIEEENKPHEVEIVELKPAVVEESEPEIKETSVSVEAEEDDLELFEKSDEYIELKSKSD